MQISRREKIHQAKFFIALIPFETNGFYPWTKLYDINFFIRPDIFVAYFLEKQINVFNVLNLPVVAKTQPGRAAQGFGREQRCVRLEMSAPMSHRRKQEIWIIWTEEEWRDKQRANEYVRDEVELESIQNISYSHHLECAVCVQVDVPSWP